jgi:hypothetical protein
MSDRSGLAAATLGAAAELAGKVVKLVGAPEDVPLGLERFLLTAVRARPSLPMRLFNWSI